VRAYKNRFGPANEVAIFEMHDDGLEEVPNPSAALMSQRSQSPGSAILAAVEGTRPLLIEVQALVSPTHFPSPRRMAMGIDANRVSLLLAVLERKGAGTFVQHDIYVNVAGGLQIDEPALGFRRIVVPQSNAAEIRADIEAIPLRRVEDIAPYLFTS
jgi:DNA repair protein RadA/Sms